jgi:hypothetical protein
MVVILSRSKEPVWVGARIRSDVEPSPRRTSRGVPSTIAVVRFAADAEARPVGGLDHLDDSARMPINDEPPRNRTFITR